MPVGEFNSAETTPIQFVESVATTPWLLIHPSDVFGLMRGVVKFFPHRSIKNTHAAAAPPSMLLEVLEWLAFAALDLGVDYFKAVLGFH